MGADEVVALLREALKAFGPEYPPLLDLAIYVAKNMDPALGCGILSSISDMVKERTGVDVWKLFNKLCEELTEEYRRRLMEE